jgi:hypothetical protein
MEGLTEADIVGALSAAYGIGSKPAAAAKSEQDRFGDREDVLARWEDGQYRFDLMRVSYGPAYKLVCVLKRLEAPALAAIVEAERLDRQEAPERDAARFAADQETERANLEKARLVNKARFRP